MILLFHGNRASNLCNFKSEPLAVAVTIGMIFGHDRKGFIVPLLGDEVPRALRQEPDETEL